MAHPKWCGKPCSKCAHPCALDESIPCSPDCEELDPITGEPAGEACRKCDALPREERVSLSLKRGKIITTFLILILSMGMTVWGDIGSEIKSSVDQRLKTFTVTVDVPHYEESFDIVNKEYLKLDYMTRMLLRDYKMYAWETEGKTKVRITAKYLLDEEQEAYIKEMCVRIAKEESEKMEKELGAELTVYNKIYLVNQFITNKIDYDYSLKISNPYEALKSGKGVCTTYTYIAYQMLKELGVENQVTIASLKENGKYHIWNRIEGCDGYTEGKVYTNVDFTLNDNYPNTVVYFTDEQMENDYNWKAPKEKELANGETTVSIEQ